MDPRAGGAARRGGRGRRRCGRPVRPRQRLVDQRLLQGVLARTRRTRLDRHDLGRQVSEYRTWLAGVISEAERLYRIQTQSLDAAENAISQSRARLESAFNRLAELQKQVLSAIAADGTPTADAKVASRIAQASSNSNSDNGSSAAKTVSTKVNATKSKKSGKSVSATKKKTKKSPTKSR